ncbi:MAG: ArsR/SmtB family transcription factor [Syntrophothermus sp.]
MSEVVVPVKITRTIKVLNSLADETRQKILLLIGTQGKLCVNEIAAHFSLSRPAISHHLKVLKDSRLVSAEKLGKEMYYSFNRDYVLASLQWLMEYIQNTAKAV